MSREEFLAILKRNWGVWLALMVLFLFSGYKSGQELWRWFKLRTDYNSITKNIEQTQQQLAELKKKLTGLSDPQVLEKEARAKLNLKKEGESVLVVVSEDSFPKEDFLREPTKSWIVDKDSFWFNVINWKRYFFR